MNFTDIYLIEKKTNEIFNVKNCLNLKKINSNFKKIDSITRKILVHGNLNLILEKEKKNCEIIENTNHKVINNIFLNNGNTKNISVDLFPFISKYDNILLQKIIIYFDNKHQIQFQIIEETQINSNKNTIFVRIENISLDHNFINYIISFIQE